jgi:hypothetical protein
LSVRTRIELTNVFDGMSTLIFFPEKWGKLNALLVKTTSAKVKMFSVVSSLLLYRTVEPTFNKNYNFF